MEAGALHFRICLALYFAEAAAVVDVVYLWLLAVC
jgi:hypothetical protein